MPEIWSEKNSQRNEAHLSSIRDSYLSSDLWRIRPIDQIWSAHKVRRIEWLSTQEQEDDVCLLLRLCVCRFFSSDYFIREREREDCVVSHHTSVIRIDRYCSKQSLYHSFNFKWMWSASGRRKTNRSDICPNWFLLWDARWSGFDRH